MTAVARAACRAAFVAASATAVLALLIGSEASWLYVLR